MLVPRDLALCSRRPPRRERDRHGAPRAARRAAEEPRDGRPRAARHLHSRDLHGSRSGPSPVQREVLLRRVRQPPENARRLHHRLDQRLRQYGDETTPIRANLRAYLAAAIADTWRDEPRPYGVYPVYSDAPEGVERAPLGNLLIEVDTAVRKLEPADPFHAGLANQLQTETTDLLQQRRLAIETAHDTISCRCSSP